MCLLFDFQAGIRASHFSVCRINSKLKSKPGLDPAEENAQSVIPGVIVFHLTWRHFKYGGKKIQIWAGLNVFRFRRNTSDVKTLNRVFTIPVLTAKLFDYLAPTFTDCLQQHLKESLMTAQYYSVVTTQ